MAISKRPSTQWISISLNRSVHWNTDAAWRWNRRIVVARVMFVVPFPAVRQPTLSLAPICQARTCCRNSPDESREFHSISLYDNFNTSNSLVQHLISLVLSITMLSRQVLVASRFLRTQRTSQLRYPFPVLQQLRSYADQVVKVPQMAESISEGTLKQFSKQIGDFVELDEEIATIETDKASLPSLPQQSCKNAPANICLSRSMSLSMLLYPVL